MFLGQRVEGARGRRLCGSPCARADAPLACCPLLTPPPLLPPAPPYLTRSSPPPLHRPLPPGSGARQFDVRPRWNAATRDSSLEVVLNPGLPQWRAGVWFAGVVSAVGVVGSSSSCGGGGSCGGGRRRVVCWAYWAQ